MALLTFATLALLSPPVATAAPLPPPPDPAPGVRVLGILAYDSTEAAAKAWRADSAVDDSGARIAKRSTAPVEPLVLGGRPVLRCRCNFKDTTIPRAVWDHEIALDLTRATAVVFDIYAENIGAVGSAQLYLRSGDGWYGASWYPKQENAWCRVRIPKSAFFVDKAAAGWSHVAALRLSPWAMKREDAVLHIANVGIEETDGSVSVVVQEYENDPAEQRTSTQFAATVQSLFEGAGLPLPSISTLELTPGILQGTRVAIIPYAAKMSAQTTAVLAGFVRGGGKLITCFSVPADLAALLGVKQESYRAQAFPGQFASMRFAGTPPAGAPASVEQRSWGILAGRPVEGVGNAAAWWHDEKGDRTDAPAIILSKNGAWFSHVLLKDDVRAKGTLLLALAEQFVPGVRRQACARRISLLGADVSEPGWQDALSLVRAMPEFGRTEAPAALKEAAGRAENARKALAAGDWPAATAAADQADALLRRAYCLAQRPVRPEFRGTWCHPREGIRGWGWEKTAAHLAASGIDHLLINVLHGASTSYPSKFAPFDRGDPERRDYLTEAVAACSRHGIKVHVWITNYALHGHAPDDFVARLKAEGRLQVDSAGGTTPDLCPSNDANVQLQKDLMLEAATWPGVAGVHFDYIRYPGEKTCFCPTCRRKFEERLGKAVDPWPAGVLPGGALAQEWLQFRRDNITRLVREVHEAVRRAAPACRISAAVFNNYPACRDGVGQDWGLWVKNGWLDFVCPMNYTASLAQFRNLSKAQLEVVGGKVPCYPGIGLLEGLGPVGAVRQIQATRDLGTGGFIVWSVFPEYINEVYPYLGIGILR